MRTTTRTTIDDRSFGELLRRWNRHQDLRSEGAPIADLANSRAALDEARVLLRHAA